MPKAAALGADEYDLYYDGGSKTGFLPAAEVKTIGYLPSNYTTEAFHVYASGDGMLRVAYGSSFGTNTGVVVGYNKANSMSATNTIDIPAKMPAYRYNTTIGLKAGVAYVF